MLRIALIVAGALLSFAANAQSVRLKNYLNPENEKIREFDEVYLAGAVDALTTYNMAASVKLFCKEGEPVSHEEAAHLLSDWAKTQTRMPDNTLIVIPLLLLLKRTYPCHEPPTAGRP